MDLSVCAICLLSVSARPNTCCATDTELAPELLTTMMPNSLHASTSIMS